jgi:tetratricopeptide (TPR) repeat protein/DNA-binding transcriptional regulator YiaG
MDRQGKEQEPREDYGELYVSEEPEHHPTNLKTLRLQRGFLKINGFAEFLGVQPTTYRDWEKGKHVPAKKTRDIICSLLHRQEIEIWPTLYETSKERKERRRSTLQRKKPATTRETKGISTQLLIWNVPYLRNIYFTGREDILTNLHKTFFLEKKTIALTQPYAISGLGGIGKTQVALEYAHRYGNEYKAILWVGAESQEQLISDFIALASLLQLSEREDSNANRVLAAVKRWLQSNTDWLLIFDNASDIKAVLKFVPTREMGHILLTTRSQISGENIKNIEVKKMEPEEGILFLLRRAMIIAENATLESASDAERKGAEEIYNLVDGLPIALAKAGAYIAGTQCSISRYIERYRERPLELLSVPSKFTENYPDSVVTTWLLSFENVQKNNPASADLLRLCAFLHPDAIPEEMILTNASNLGPNLLTIADDPIQLDEAIGELRKYSLIQRNPNTKTLTIHRLVQAVIQDGIPESEKKRWAERVIKAVNAVFPNVEFGTWSRCERYLVHALACAQWIDQLSMNFAESARLLDLAGRYSKERALYVQAEQLCNQSLNIRRKILETGHPDVVQSLSSLAELYFAQGKYQEAEHVTGEALRICEQAPGLGPIHPTTLENLNNLGVIYRMQGKYVQAESLFQQALTIREKTLGLKNPDTAISLNTLASLYRIQGKYQKAEALFRRALEIDEQVLGLKHPNTLVCVNNLAVLYRTQEKYQEAEQFFLRVITTFNEIRGPKHPDTVSALNNLAVTYSKQGKYKQAESLFHQALMIREEVLGMEHPDVVTSLSTLGSLYRKQGKYEQAEQLLSRALRICDQSLDPEYSEMTSALNNLAGLYSDQGKYEQAELLYQRLLAILEQALEAGHPDIVQALQDYATLLRKMNRGIEAGEMEERAQSIQA